MILFYPLLLNVLGFYKISRPLGLSESKHLFCLACLSEVAMSLSPAFCSTILHKESNLKEGLQFLRLFQPNNLIFLQHEEISYNGISRMVKIASENISADKEFKSSDLILQNRIQRVQNKKYFHFFS